MNRIAKGLALTAVALTLSLPLGACEKSIRAPAEAGVCYQAIFLKDGGVRFNKLTDHVAKIEACAAALEAMRLRFEVMGGASEIIGAYQGNYIFLLKEGIFRSDSLKGARYPMLVRIGGGQLAQPGAVPQSLLDQAKQQGQ
jgi:hypothetical protein